MEYQVYKDRKKNFRWRLVSDNSKKIACSGEGYKRRVDCLKAISLVQTSCEAGVVDSTVVKKV